MGRGVGINSVKMSDGHTLLMTAVAPGHPDVAVVKLLVAQGADVNAQDVRGHSALLASVVSKSAEKLEVLLKAWEQFRMTTGLWVEVATYWNPD